VLEREHDLEVRGGAEDADQCLAATRECGATMVLLDAGAPDALVALARLRSLRRPPRVVVLGLPEDEDAVVAYAEAGVSAYVTREDSVEALIAALRAAARGEMPCSSRTPLGGRSRARRSSARSSPSSSPRASTGTSTRSSPFAGPNGGERAVHAFHTVLPEGLAEAAPKIGETVGIKYVGRVESESGGYHKYKVVVDRADGGVDWSAYAEDAGHPRTGPAPDEAMRELHEPLPEPAASEGHVPF
jgi:CheY-like chemotaxis protein